MKTVIKTFILSFLISSSLFAQFNGMKIMINPGHGGHDSDDRYIPATGFWESEGNLTKGLHLRDLLEARGAEIIMSRTLNRSIDGLPLSQISAIANENDVDYFQSIHSNGFQGTANRTGVFWEQLSNGQPDFPLAKYASEILAEKIYEVVYTTSFSDRGDLTYLGFNLGVLRSLNMPGCLTEGSFHDYIPESYRLLNLDYRKHEAVAILRGMLEYFALPPLEHGAIAGLVKDDSKLVSYNFTGGNFNDRYKPVNNLMASLYQDTLFLKSFHGDFNNNGYFVFDSIAPGGYKLVLDYGYFKSDTLQVAVSSNQSTFLEIFPDPSNQNVPQVYGTFPENNQIDFNTYTSLEIIFNQSMNHTTTEASFSIAPNINGTFSWKENSQVLVFNPQVAFQPQTNYQITISTQAQNTLAINLQDSIAFSFTTADHVYPQVSKTIPAQNDSITIFENIEVFFDQDMIREKVEDDFDIQPFVNGIFNWTDDKHFTFYPDTLFIGTEYTINVSDSALNSFSVGLENDFQFNFRTYKRNALNIISWYPAMADTAVSTRVNFYFHFDGTLEASTVLANLALEDDNQNSLEMTSYKLEERNGTSVLRCDSKEELKRNRMYRITIYPGILDLDELLFRDSLSFSFTTEKEGYESGVILDGFEDDTGWQDPEFGPQSRHIDNDNSDFGISVVENINGNKSAVINYQFTNDSMGICQVFREDDYLLTLDNGSSLGLWVYGDYSFNTLELWYDTATLQNQSVHIDTLNYSGWKLLKIPVDLFDNLNILLHSIVIRQQPEGYKQSKIYIDDLQTNVITDISGSENTSIVSSFKLLQNYPNPFNPKTIINYQLAVGANHYSPVHVELSIYNLLGQKVATLVSKKQAAGKYSVEWNALGYASGIYFYQIIADKFVQTKKMLIVK